MAGIESSHHGELRKCLAQLDLYQHSLRLLGQELVAHAGTSSAVVSGPLYEKSLQLGEDCSMALHRLRDRLDAEDVCHCESTLERVDQAVNRAGLSKEHTLLVVNVWRVVEAVEQFLGRVAVRYGYTTLSERMTVAEEAAVKAGGAPFAPCLGSYVQATSVEREAPRQVSIPAWRAIPRWRTRRLLNPGLLLGIVIVLSFVAVAIAAPIIAPPWGDDPYTMPRSSYLVEPEPPSARHPLGTTEQSYDVFYGLVWGSHIAFRIGLSVTAARLVIGLVLGLVSGYYGGWLDAVLMRITDAFLAFPIVPATLVMLTFFGPLGLAEIGAASGIDAIIVLSLVLFGWMQYARLVRGNVLAERSRQYVEAAVTLGARGRHIILRHILPNIPQGLFVLAASDVGAMVVLSAVFTFLGLSGRRGLADWGWMLNTGRNWIVGTPSNAFQYWYAYLPPIVAIVLFSVGWSLIGDGLRDVLDPRV
jgi:peptide/nickel transport system permease protein